MVRGCHQSKLVDVEHIPGIINPSNISTNEMKDITHFRNLRDSMMVSLQEFLKYSQIFPIHIISANKIPSMLFHMVRTHSPIQSRNQNRRSRARCSKRSRTSIGGQTDRIKRSSLHFYQHEGVDGSQVNES